MQNLIKLLIATCLLGLGIFIGSSWTVKDTNDSETAANQKEEQLASETNSSLRSKSISDETFMGRNDLNAIFLKF